MLLPAFSLQQDVLGIAYLFCDLGVTCHVWLAPFSGFNGDFLNKALSELVPPLVLLDGREGTGQHNSRKGKGAAKWFNSYFT